MRSRLRRRTRRSLLVENERINLSSCVKTQSGDSHSISNCTKKKNTIFNLMFLILLRFFYSQVSLDLKVEKVPSVYSTSPLPSEILEGRGVLFNFR